MILCIGVEELNDDQSLIGLSMHGYAPILLPKCLQLMLDTLKRTTPEAPGGFIGTTPGASGSTDGEMTSINCSLSFICERRQESWDRHDGGG